MNVKEVRTSGGNSERKGGLSCAECRRSKLKCDRIFPCQSCVRRGCGNICPDGTLAATKGNKVLLAHAQRLTEQIKTANARIKDLERALAEAQSQMGCNGPHPLLKEAQDIPIVELETIYDDVDGTVHDVTDTIGSLSIGPDGKARYYGETAGSEYFQELMQPQGKHLKTRDPKDLGLPSEITDLFNAFPLGIRDCLYTKAHLCAFVPSREKALEWADLYYKNVAWMYDPVVQKEFLDSIIKPIYDTTVFPCLDTIHPHRLSVFFILLASGIYFEDDPLAAVLAEQYHTLSRAAFSLSSILRDANCATVQAIFMIMRYIFISDRVNNEERWLLGGLCARVSQIIGLQRDSGSWDLDEDEIQRRRVLFWEVFTHDAWGSVVNGRPPSLSIYHTDCRFPNDLYAVKTPGNVELGWHAWKVRYTACCLSLSVHHIFCTKASPYSALLELDKKIRQFPIPSHLQAPLQTSEAGYAWSPDPSRANQQYCLLCERESNLLYIHRNSFVQAIRAEPLNPLRHKYGRSVLAVYRSACRMIAGLKGLYSVHPKLSSHQWFFWSSVYSSCIVLGALVIESVSCELSQNALQELEQALPFYEEGSASCRPPATFNMLQKLLKRAQATFAAFQAGTPLKKSDNHPDEPDAFGLLGSRKGVISDRSPSDFLTFNTPVPSLPQHHLTGEANQNTPTQSGYQQYEVLPNSLDHAVFEDPATITQQEMNDFDGYMSTFRRAGNEPVQAPEPNYGLPQHIEQQTYIPDFHFPQQAPYSMSLHPQRPSSTDFTMVNDNRDEIWPNFIRQLGLTGERA